MKFGEELKRRIAEKELKLYEVGGQCGISPSLLSQMISRELRPSKIQLEKLCKFFGDDLEKFVQQ